MKNYGFFKDLYINLEDTELLKVSKIFLDDLEKNFKMFNDNYDKNYNELEKYLDNTNVIFTPEKISKKSPLTILNAPWGSGKTFFIENFARLLIDNKLNSKIFKKVIIIDSWKFSNSKDIPIEFALELSDKIIDINVVDENIDTIKSLKKKFLDRIIPKSFSWGFGFMGIVNFQCTHGSSNNSKEINNTTEIEDAWQKIQSPIEPVIIFIDNLERLGSSSWDLLKAILKLQEFKNYLIILPLNINKLSNNQRIDNSEYPIEKYIDFNYYNLKQDYLHFFNKHFKNKELIDKLNIIFNTDIEGEKLSIREIENSFMSLELFKKDNQDLILKKIRQKIWFPKDIFNVILREDLKYFLSLEQRKCKLFLKVADNLLEIDDSGQYINISDFHVGKKESKNMIVILEESLCYHYIVGYDYMHDYILFSEIISFKRQENENSLKHLNKELKDMKIEIEKYKNDKEELNKRLKKLEKEEQTYKNSDVDYNSRKYNSIQVKIIHLINKLNEVDNIINRINSEYINKEITKSNIVRNMKRMFNIIPIIDELKQINKQNNFAKSYRNELLSILNKNFNELNIVIERNTDANIDVSKITY